MKPFFLFLVTITFIIIADAQPLPKPSPQQLAWQQWETNAFLHFTVNTFTGKEWGDGTEDPKIFNPVDFNADQIISTLKEAGFRMAIITAKHHDGFCLWPSQYTDHSVKKSPWKNGKGDIVKEIATACKRYGLKFGIYLSPWDRHEASYGTDAYNTYYKNQLKELLTDYGEVSEVWFDGAKGENAKSMQYDFKGYWQLVKKLQPNAVIFSDAGPDIRWVGNENGNAGATCWSTIDTAGMAPGKADAAYLNTGDPNGKSWIPAETDVSIRPGWFYHPEEDNRVKTPQALFNIYCNSVGRNSLLLLNIPPDKKGLLHADDIKALKEWRKLMDKTFAQNLLKGAKKNIKIENDTTTIINYKLNAPQTFDLLLLQEDIHTGQRIKKFVFEYKENNDWKQLAEGTTIGYKRIVRFSPVHTNAIRLRMESLRMHPVIAAVGLYKQ